MNESRSSNNRRGRWQLLVIAALFFGPLLLAIGWYLLVPHIAPRPAAHGTLIDPARPLDPFELTRSGGASFTLEDLRGRWTLIHVIDRTCHDACRERLYFTRQIHTALGQDRLRVQRVVLAPTGRQTSGLSDVLPEHPGLTVLAASENDPLRRQLPGDVDSGTVLLVDPLGNLMLRFGPGVAPDGILEDLEKLLKLSQVG